MEWEQHKQNNEKKEHGKKPMQIFIDWYERNVEKKWNMRSGKEAELNYICKQRR